MISTHTADVTVTGRCGNADIASGASDGSADHVDGDLRLRYGSGNCHIERVAGSVRTRSGSGAAHFGEVAGALTSACGSGQLEIGTAKQRDTAVGERDQLTDKYHATKWQLSAAVNSMPQGIIMLDPAAKVLAVNDQYRKMYGLPSTIKTGSSLREILQHRAENGLFAGNVAKDLAASVARIAKRQPSTHEITLGDGRVFSIKERPMDGGGVVAVHDDITEQRRSQWILERTEQLLATIIENVPQAIVAKDARDLRYVLVNRAAEKMIGMSRAEILGKTARELFPAEMAALIERRDRQLLAQQQQLEPIVDTVDSPIPGRRTIAVRRRQVGGPDRESHLFVSMIEDRTDQAHVAGIAA